MATAVTDDVRIVNNFKFETFGNIFLPLQPGSRSG